MAFLRLLKNAHPETGNKAILMVANWDSGVGYAWWLMENFWTTIAQHFRQRHIESILIYPTITTLPDSISTSKIEVLEHDFNDRSSANLKKLHKIIKDNRVTFLYLSDQPKYSLYYILIKLWGVETIVVHDHTPGDRAVAKSWKRLVKQLVERIPFYTADHFIAATDFIYRRFLDVNCIPEKKCTTVPNGIVPVNKSGSDTRLARREFNIPEDRFIVVNTGRASYYKGIDFLIECAAKLINFHKMNVFHFLYCGDGPDITEFRALVNYHGIDDYFTFAGHRDDVRDLLLSCDIALHTSHGEVGYSLSILEYMSAGLVTVVPDLPSTSLIIDDEENGLIYKAHDVCSAANAIKMAATSDKCDKIRENARCLVSETFNIEKTNQKLVKVLDEIYSESSRCCAGNRYG